ncbi:hypothetical protein AO373_0493 [Moraxella catarrhalis]|uniref:hypothetical protein n=1 Tax=Moraxella catarrhalis TaxID=480 RepID=UPI0007F3B9CA|nr:hypothetical protein [Moraxella catarrhalis]OAV03652.1 hypothetical protein AO381_1029 [Moraxella catarrhalis]OAV07196.1 hypothetical protein AO379_0349 [Moraxella catarrhalis]OAV19267.1 hypothetical protein AO373_0493 [Moraxella catarrhalis]
MIERDMKQISFEFGQNHPQIHLKATDLFAGVGGIRLGFEQVLSLGLLHKLAD